MKKTALHLFPFYLGEKMPSLEIAREFSPAVGAWRIAEPDLPAGNPQARMGALYSHLAELSAADIRAGRLPVVLSGDCIASLGMLGGLQRAGLSPLLIWLDSHGDFNTWETSPSGYLGGMPLAMLTGRGEQTMPRAIGLKAQADEDIILADGRNLDPQEAQALAKSAVIHLPKLDYLPAYDLPEQPIYLHIDVDIINPLDLPAVGFVSPGGARLESFKRVLLELAQTGAITAISISAWDPEKDEQHECARILMPILLAIIESARLNARDLK
jgi:arginase